MASKPQTGIAGGFEDKNVPTSGTLPDPTNPLSTDDLGLTPEEIAQVRGFFEILDRWDREYRERVGLK